MPGYQCDPASNVCLPDGTVHGVGGSGGVGAGGGSGGCVSLEDCPMPPRPCESRMCLGGSRGTQAVPAGTVVPAAEQTPGDCSDNHVCHSMDCSGSCACSVSYGASDSCYTLGCPSGCQSGKACVGDGGCDTC